MCKNAFVLPFGHYKFTWLPFGLTNAPRIFQKCIMTLFQEFDFVKVFLDDVLIHSETEELHNEHFLKVLTRFKEIGACINFDRSTFYSKEVKYLGNIISGEGIRADVSRVPDMLDIATLRTKKGLQKVICFLNWL